MSTMATPMNLSAVQSYAEKLAHKLCTPFFTMNNHINGNQILDLCAVKQLNFMVIRSLFSQWQNEMDKIRSPFFDFQDPEVKKASQAFMNVLSRHIHIHRSQFEPLMAEAIKDTIHFCYEPYVYLRGVAQQLPSSFTFEKDFKGNIKYFKIHSQIVGSWSKELQDQFAPDAPIKRDFALDILHKIEKGPQQSAPEVSELLDALQKQLAFKKEDFYSLSLLDQAPTSFFDEMDTSLSHTATKEENIQVTPIKTENPSSELTDFVQSRVNASVKETEEDLSIDSKSSIIESSFEKERIPEIIEEDLPPITSPKYNLEDQKHDYTNREQWTDVMQAIVQTRKGRPFSEQIPVHDKIQIKSKLFNDDSVDFDKMLTYMDACKSYEEAIDYIKVNYFRKYQWNWEQDEVKLFYMYVQDAF